MSAVMDDLNYSLNQAVEISSKILVNTASFEEKRGLFNYLSALQTLACDVESGSSCELVKLQAE